ncbi:MAG: bifunctional UDP-N-acetylglucosamine diphosphorylase/glucosamine-1-phosphate N-acetyltransferase GlmU [Candidatus Paracaedimonas acanthamoebae]|uniref:Bifunctional protein GlmU n=1 Tax=Candidatus Paracaedimonas acanthamoebae TaxID=244581 RepID=A0A8J7PVX5_9PROT|nr:bifunctional UDP-N-acetylglucosamine diphosphorylase/glucosamine-1-phosphate N-acetyltransferase GlmU [Candidatus Paracaedimonas acanthamoebae]
MSDCSLLTLILAAGKGTRMRSSLPKVLHPIGGRPMIHYILETASALQPEKVALVVSDSQESVVHSAQEMVPELIPVIQEQQLGTAHAVLSARSFIKNFKGIILILFGDTPLVRHETLLEVLDRFKNPSRPAAVILGMQLDDPKMYGRIVTSHNNQVEAIIEHREANEEIKKIKLCNAGVMALDGNYAVQLLEKITPQISNQERYLTDIVAIARSEALKVEVVIAQDPSEFEGINTRKDLAEIEAKIQNRWRAGALEKGVTMIAPETVFLSYDTQISSDVTIHPYVNVGPKTIIEENVTIRSFTDIEGSHIKKGVTIGPFARLRPTTILEEGVKIGNFVEVKNSTLGIKAKANHLTYIGDAIIGEKTNIGAGTITCNYDGFSKWKTHIGNYVSIGANSSLVAPLKIGDHAYIGAGSTITKDVASESLAVARAQVKEIEKGALALQKRKSTQTHKKDVT